MEKFVEEDATYEKYGDLTVKVFAPQYYYPKGIKLDKYSHEIILGKHTDKSRFFSQKICKVFEYVNQEIKANIIIVIPASTPEKYSPTLLKIAKDLSEKTGIPTENLIIKTRTSKKLTGCATKEERYEATHGTLKLSRQLTGEKCIILLDDTRTSGITILECAKILKDGGATEVVALCLGINESRAGYV